MTRKKGCLKATASLLVTGLLVLNTVATVLADPPELSLDDSIAMALQNNPSINMAVSDKDKAAWGIKEMEAGKMPALSLTNSDSRASSMADSLPGNSFNTALRLSVPLYTGGRNEALIDQAKFNADAANLGVDKAKGELRLNTTTAYFNVLQNHNLVKVNQETVDNLTAHLKNVQAQNEAGTVAKSDVLRSEVELANAQQNLVKTQNAYDLAAATLNNVIGTPLDTQNTLKDQLSFVPYNLSLEDSIKLALKNRPEIAQSKDSIDTAKAGITIADSGRLPTIAASGTEGISGSNFPGQNRNWSAGVSATWNLFDSGLTSAKVKEAATAVDKAKETDQQTRDSIELEVRQAYLSMTEAGARIQSSQVAVDQATEGLKTAQAKYSAGVGTNLDVIDAQVALTQAQTNDTQALYDYNVNKAKLEKAVGLGMK
jgi:outer membrane protein TolC